MLLTNQFNPVWNSLINDEFYCYIIPIAIVIAIVYSITYIKKNKEFYTKNVKK